MTTVYFVRHAETDSNTKGIVQGTTDIGVSENGYRQLEKLSERFKDIKLDAIYASPLIRTVETAKAVNKYHNIDIQTDKGLIEMNFGKFEKMTWDELPEKYPDMFKVWCERIYDFSAENGESMRGVYKRMTETVGSIIKHNKGKTIAIVSHGCALKNYFCYVKDYDFTELEKVDWPDNTSVTEVLYDDKMNHKVVCFNNTDHLEGIKIVTVNFDED